MTKIAPIAMLLSLLCACGSPPTAVATPAITQVPSATPAPSNPQAHTPSHFDDHANAYPHADPIPRTI